MSIKSPSLKDQTGAFTFASAEKLEDFNGRGQRYTAAAADGGQTERLAAFFHGMNERHHDPASRRSHRMSQTNAAAVDIGNLPFQSQFFFAADILTGKRFIEFNQL